MVLFLGEMPDGVSVFCDELCQLSSWFVVFHKVSGSHIPKSGSTLNHQIHVEVQTDLPYIYICIYDTTSYFQSEVIAKKLSNVSCPTTYESIFAGQNGLIKGCHIKVPYISSCTISILHIMLVNSLGLMLLTGIVLLSELIFIPFRILQLFSPLFR